MASRIFSSGVRALTARCSASGAAQARNQHRSFAGLAGRCASAASATATAAATTTLTAKSALADALLQPSFFRQQQLLAGSASLAFTQLTKGHRGIFGKADQVEEAQETDASLELPNIGGEGGYFDHDESHEGLAQRELIASLFDDWNAALATKDPQQVANLYAHDAVLLPTVSNEVRTTRAGIIDYFSTFLKLSPQGKVDQSQIRMLSPNLALHSGVYSFTRIAAPQARFTFLYAPDGVLLPTVSNQVRTCRQGIIDYFTSFLALKPYGRIDKCIIRELAPDVAINSGVYTFKLTRDTGVDNVQARYTFIYKKIDDRWFISEHHSSAMPEN